MVINLHTHVINKNQKESQKDTSLNVQFWGTSLIFVSCHFFLKTHEKNF